MHLHLYHRTTPENAARILAELRMVSRENTDEAYFSNRADGQADGYGTAVVHVYVPASIAELDDEFPSGEQHFRVKVAALRPEHFLDGAHDRR